MAAELAAEVDQLLEAITHTQEALSTVYQAKRAAIRQARADEMDQLTQQEQDLVAQVQAQLRRREQILRRVQDSGQQADTLEGLVQSMPAPDRDRLLPRVAQARRVADGNRRESWVLWIVAQQSMRVFGEILDLIAHGGRKSPVYSARPESEVTVSGGILDASA